MTRQNKLKKILEVLSPDKASADFKQFDESIEQLKRGLKEKIQIAAVEDINKELEKFRKKIDLQPLFDTVDSLHNTFVGQMEELSKGVEDRINEIESSVLEEFKTRNKNSSVLFEEITKLQDVFSVSLEKATEEINTLRKSLDSIDIIKEIKPNIKELSDKLNGELDKKFTRAEIEKITQDLNNKIEKLRTDLISRFSGYSQIGGNMNRQIKVDGTDVLTKYTDIDLKSSTNVLLSAANDNTNKKVNITV